MAPEQIAPSCCGRVFVVQGIDSHRPADFTGKVSDEEKPFYRDEVYGLKLTATVSGLPAGKYRVVFYEMESYWSEAGERKFDISVHGQKLASDVDLFAEAGGQHKPFKIEREFEHPGDAQRGPVAFEFLAKTNYAKFNGIRIYDESGEPVACVKAEELADPQDEFGSVVPQVGEPKVWLDPKAPIDRRVDDLIARMSLREKVTQLTNTASPIPRLGVPAYDYWNECLHGVARAGVATVFPQAIGMAAMWDAPFLHEIGDIISTEARAKNNDALARGEHGRYYGLTFWTPNINIFRDPRWGRGQETYGEDPRLTADLGVALITGLQGDDPRYLKVAACAKHFAVHSGPESLRHEFDATPPQQDLYETYLPQFEAAVKRGKVGIVMSAYNALDGTPCSADAWLLQTLLRQTWGFDGHVTSDCGAISDLELPRKVAADPAEAAAMAIKSGCDIECGNQYRALLGAAKKSLVTEKEIDTALHRVLRTRFELGQFDPPDMVTFMKIPISENDSPAHASAALKAARQSMVLLKNDGVLPLDPARLKKVAVIGENADSTEMLLGNYNGTPSHPVSILQGLRKALGRGVEVTHERGVPLALRPGETVDASSPDWKKALAAAASADVVIYVGGLSPRLEGEEMRVNFQGFGGGDRTRIELPEPQDELLKALHATGRPVIFVNCSGSAVAMPWEAGNLPAILQAWYPGQAGGTAVAETLLGRSNPSGRLPVTFYSATSDLPAFEDYAMANRTYRYFSGRPLWAFGHGLSYTTFAYSDAALEKDRVAADATLNLTLVVKNSGERDGDEIVQVYARRKDSLPGDARKWLVGFQRVPVAAGKSAPVEFAIDAANLRRWDAGKKQYVVPAGDYELEIGASSDDIRERVPFSVRGGAPPANEIVLTGQGTDR